MYKHRGLEGANGLGNGIVSKASEEALAKADALAAQRRPLQALPYYVKAREDPNNLDADIGFAFLQPTTQDSLRMVTEAEERGRAILKRGLGDNALADDGPRVGSFWAIPETRPYMRVLQAIVRLGFESGSYEVAAHAGTEMMRLCPGDNLAARRSLGTMLLHSGRSSDALSFAQAWLNREFEFGGVRGGTTFKTPSERPLSADVFQELKTRFCLGDLAYTAALASYRLTGNSELSRQYLAIAASKNPQVAIRVVAKVTKPDHLHSGARSFNGPEDAHDYLYFAQELWMTPGVHKWISENEDVKALMLKTCSMPGCGKRESVAAEFKRCTACRSTHYCSQECQNAHWKQHKKECKEIQERRQMNRILSRPGKSIEGFETIKPENVCMMDMAKPPGTENTVQFAFNANH